MFFLFLFVSLFHSVILLSSQADLYITKYSQIGCLKLKSDKQFLLTNIQEDFLLSYQTISSPSMTIELCFRLCRRWYILISNNHKHCICIYAINQLYEIDEYLGEYVPKENCSSNTIEIYSLTDTLDVLSSVPASTTDDWSLDGCYYVHGIQSVRVDIWLTELNYIQAIDACRKHCQKYKNEHSVIFFLSRKKSCYCSPLKVAQSMKTSSLRKPLSHCSFHPYICKGFSISCNKYYSDTNNDTLIRIDVQHHCSENQPVSFFFDKIFNRCLRIISLTNSMIYSNTIVEQNCSALTIQRSEQWNYLMESSWITYSETFIPITQNSTYVLNSYVESQISTKPIDDLCLILDRANENRTVSRLGRCSDARTPNSILCIQKPFPSTIVHEKDFQNTNIPSSSRTHEEILSCPTGFVLFNRMCYYIHLLLNYSIRASQRVCYNQNSNSTLVKFESHDRGNINSSKFLGRRFDDLLLEFLYYYLEQKLFNQSNNEIDSKQWLRLLLGDRNDPNECVLRYFERASGGFTTFYRCNSGGYAVCQIEPYRTLIPISTTTTTTEALPIIESTTTTTTTSIMGDNENFNSTEMMMNITLLELKSEPAKRKSLISGPLIAILTSSLLAFILLTVGTFFLVRHVRNGRGTHSTSSSIAGSRRNKRSSTAVTEGDFFNHPRASFGETDMLLPIVDYTIAPTDETIELLPTGEGKLQLRNMESPIEQEENIYDVVN